MQRGSQKQCLAHTRDGKYTGASFLSTAAFRFQAIQFECLRCFQLKDGFLFQPQATVHGLLWKRRSGTTSDAARDITIVFGSVMCCHSLCCSFILVRDVFPPGVGSLQGAPRARDSLVVWCRPCRRNLGNTSAVCTRKIPHKPIGRIIPKASGSSVSCQSRKNG